MALAHDPIRYFPGSKKLSPIGKKDVKMAGECEKIEGEYRGMEKDFQDREEKS